MPRLLLDTHVLVRWLADPKRLSRAQLRAIEACVQLGQEVGVSTMTLVEISVLETAGKLKLKRSLADFFEELRKSAQLRLIDADYEVALEVAMLAVLRDPADKVIVATARVHRLRLVTSDQRIIESGLVSVVE